MRTFGWLVLIALLLAAPAWSAAKPAPPKPAPMVVKESAHFTLKSNLPPATMEALLKLCEATLDGYREVFGFSLYPNPNPGDKRLMVVATEGSQMGLTGEWSSHPAVFRLTFPETGGMSGPGQLMPWVYSRLAHAFAEPLANFDTPRFNDGFKDYLAAYVVDYTAGKVVPAGPGGFNYSQMVGSGQFEHGPAALEPGSEQAAAALLDRVGKAMGKAALGKAFREVGISEQPLQHPATKQVKVAALVQQLMDSTTEGEMEKWFQDAHFPTVLDPQNIKAAELWQLTDHNTRCRLLCQRWGASTTGILEGGPVQVLLQVASGDTAKTRGLHSRRRHREGGRQQRRDRLVPAFHQAPLRDRPRHGRTHGADGAGRRDRRQG